MTTKRLFLIDGSALAYRTHYAFSRAPLYNSRREPTSVLFGFTNSLLSLLEREKPDYIAITFDLSGPTFRHELYEDYKANRAKTPDELSQQLPILKDLLRAMGFVILEQSGQEADDIIGTLCHAHASEDTQVFIVSSDKDFAQLVDPHTRIYDPGRGGKSPQILGPDEVKEKFGVLPTKIVDYMALVGDSSDNVPGVPKVGPKTAQKLLEEHGSLDKLYEAVDTLKQKALRERLIAHKADAYLSQQLVTIRTDLPELPPLEDLKRAPLDDDTLQDLIEQIEFTKLYERITGNKGQSTIPTRKDRLLESAEALESLLQAAKTQGHLYLHGLTIYDERHQYLLALAFALEPGEAFFLPVLNTQAEEEPTQLSLLAPPPAPKKPPPPRKPVQTQLSFLNPPPTPNAPSPAKEQKPFSKADAFALLKPILEDAAIAKIGHDLKELTIALLDEAITLRGITMDTEIASYLLNPSRKHDLYHLSLQLLGTQKKQPTDVLGTGRKKKTWFELTQETLQEYLCEEVDLLARLAQTMQKTLDELELSTLMRELELPMIPILAQIERQGFPLDLDFLQTMQVTFAAQLDELFDKIQEWADDPSFNVNSSQQVAKLLYEELALHEKHDVKIRKTAKGALSTNSEALEALKEHHALPGLILEHRELQKLQSTYIEALPALAVPGPDGVNRIHTRLKQTGTATGRLSSYSPNLQNIPVRTAQGREIRKAFIPGKAGWRLMSADYSQVELRILAHMSDDDELKDAFAKEIDIHTRTASLVFDIPVDEVTPQQRNASKAVNFGCVPMDTLCLTKEGWKTFEEIQPGVDETLGYQDGRMVWTPILEKVRYEEAPLVALSSGSFRAVCTPNHRWYGSRRYGYKHRKREFGAWQTDELTPEHRLELSKPLQAEDRSGLTPAEAAVLAWLHTDGYIKWSPLTGAPSQAGGRRRGVRASILQSQPIECDEIRSLLQEAGLTYNEHIAKQKPDQKHPVSHFILRAPEIRSLWNKAKLHHQSLEELVLSFGDEQLHAFFDAAMKAEGTFYGRKARKGKTPVFTQNDGPVADALRLAIFLKGYQPRTHTQRSYTDKLCHKLLLCRPIVTGQRLKQEACDPAPVWCIRTQTGSWTMRQNDQIMVTGNTIYGMGAPRLAKQIDVSIEEAEAFIAAYFRSYPKVQDYLDDTIESAEEHGYVETILGRRRYIYDLDSDDGRARAVARHVAVNTPIQGSAADLIKKAMIQIHKRMQQEQLKATMLLQVHDELLFTFPTDEEETLRRLVQEEMSQAIALKVPLVVDIGTGDNWSEAH